MPTPFVVAAGAGVTGLNDGVSNFLQITPAAPASGIVANDFLLMFVAGRAGTTVTSFTVGSGMTLQGTAGLSVNTLATGWYYRVCTGSENGQTWTVDGAYTGSSTNARVVARIYQLRNVDPGVRFDALGGSATGTANPVTVSDFTTTSGLSQGGRDRLGLCLFSYLNVTSIQRIGNGTPNNPAWADVPGGVTTLYQSGNISIQLQTKSIPVPSALTGFQTDLGTAVRWRSTSLSLAPSGGSDVVGRQTVIRQAVKRAGLY